MQSIKVQKAKVWLRGGAPAWDSPSEGLGIELLPRAYFPATRSAKGMSGHRVTT